MSAVATSTEAREIVVFDFDGTITTRDTFALFLRYYAGSFIWALKILSLLPVFAAYGLRLIDRNKVKAFVIKRFFKGALISTVNARATKFARDIIPGLVRPAAQRELDRHKADIESLYICSASISPYLREWGTNQGIKHVLATDLSVEGGVCTGEIQGWNVWGEGKMRRLRAEIAPQTLRIIEAYGDSRGDREMLHAADVSHWKPFRLSEHHD